MLVLVDLFEACLVDVRVSVGLAATLLHAMVRRVEDAGDHHHEESEDQSRVAKHKHRERDDRADHETDEERDADCRDADRPCVRSRSVAH